MAYPWALSGPHTDKEGVEYCIFRASTHIPTPTTRPPEEIIPADVVDALPENILEETIVVRPAWFVGDNEEPQEGDVEPTIGERVTVSTVKRADVARFIVDACLPGNDTWVNKQPIIGF